MTTQIETAPAAPINTASAAAEALKGKSVRATNLKIGTRYIMSQWHAPKTHTEVVFTGFGTAPDALLPAILQLKQLTPAHKFFFQAGDEQLVADGRTPGNVFIGEGAGVRCTFFELLGAEAPAVETPAAPAEAAAPAPAKAPRKARAKKATTEAAAPAETVVEAPAAPTDTLAAIEPTPEPAVTTVEEPVAA